MVSESLYLVLVGLSTLVAVAVAAWLWDEDASVPGRLFVAVAASYALTGALVCLELLVASRSLSIVVYGLHAGVATLFPFLWFWFALAYTGNLRRVPRAALGLLVGFYAVYVGIEVTNPLHHLMWSEYSIASGPLAHVTADPTTLATGFFLPQTLIFYSVLGLFAAYLLLGSGLRRTQTGALFVGYLSSFVVVNAWFFGTLPGPLDGALVVGSTWSLALAAWAVFRHQLFDLTPLARETVLDVLEDAVVVVDSDRRLLDFNERAAETVPSLARHEGDPIETVLPGIVADASSDPSGTGPNETDGHTSELDGTVVGDDAQASGASESPFVSSFRRFEDGTVHEYEVTASPLRVRGSIEGYTLVLRDVTDLNRQVRDLEQQTTQLEQFASTLSHDLRNPLNVAHGRVQIAEETGETDEHLAKATDALERMDQIIQDTLTLAREGETIDERERVALSTVARNAWATADTGDAALEVLPDADLRIYADATRLRSAFENCFRNAVDHGGNDVTVAVGRTADGFFVADDGPGVPVDEREQVFEYAYTTADEGTGLGLAIVEAIASAHGWTVSMTESADGGAKVVFTGVDVVEDQDSAGTAGEGTDVRPAGRQ